VCPKIVMTTMSLRLSAGARSEEVFATHSREPFAVAGGDGGRESVIVHLDELHDLERVKGVKMSKSVSLRDAPGKFLDQRHIPTKTIPGISFGTVLDRPRMPSVATTPGDLCCNSADSF
jgi:hypothetical protein